MNPERFRPPINRQVIEEASEWFVAMDGGDVDIETRRRFHEWLARSPDHIEAYLKILPVWEDGAQLDTHANDREALIVWARTGTNIVPLAVPKPAAAEVVPRDRAPSRADVARKNLYEYAFAASVALTASAALTFFVVNKGVYATSVGEQRSVALDDGSSVELNSRSKVSIRFNGRERFIELLEGQALFKVAKDPARPFVVQSGETSVRAVGTQFDVYKKRTGTIVTVVEGKVAVASQVPVPPLSGTSQPPSLGSASSGNSGMGAFGPVVLNAGQQLTVDRSVSMQPKQTNPAVVTAWTQQQLVFFRTPLPEVAEEFNRYNKRQLVVRDGGLKAFHVSGTFSSTDPSLLIQFLQDQPGLKIEATGNEVSVTAR